MRTANQIGGDAAEELVAERLMAIGWSIAARNVHAGRGELDIVAVDPGPPAMLVIVEVRARRRRDFGLAEETLDHRKRAHLRRAIARLADGGLPGGAALPRLPIRVDLIVVETGRAGGASIRHHRAVAL